MFLVPSSTNFLLNYIFAVSLTMGRRRSGKKFTIRKAIAVAAGNQKRASAKRESPHSGLKISNIHSLCNHWWNSTKIPIPKDDSFNRQSLKIVSIEHVTRRIYIASGNPPTVRLVGAAFQSEVSEQVVSSVEDDRVSEASTVPASPETATIDWHQTRYAQQLNTCNINKQGKIFILLYIYIQYTHPVSLQSPTGAFRSKQRSIKSIYSVTSRNIVDAHD